MFDQQDVAKVIDLGHSDVATTLRYYVDVALAIRLPNHCHLACVSGRPGRGGRDAGGKVNINR